MKPRIITATQLKAHQERHSRPSFALGAVTPMPKPLSAALKPKIKPKVPKQSEGEALFIGHCKIYRLNPIAEYRFHLPRKWRFDFAWPDVKIAVEIEGGTWGVSRHTTGSGFAADCDKYNDAAKRGWIVLRYTTDMVKNGSAILDVLEILA